MPAVIMIENSYSNEDAIERLITYILNSKKAPAYGVCGSYVNIMNTEFIINHFKMIQNVFGKTTGRRVRHVVVSFAKHEGIADVDVSELQYHAVNYFGSLGHQAIAAIHKPIEQNDLLHFHLAINTVNIYNGSKYSGNYTQNMQFFNYIKSIEPYNCLRWELESKYSTKY